MIAKRERVWYGMVWYMTLSELEETKEEGSFAATQQDGVYSIRAKRAG